jgi:hypothetical protein
MLNVRRIQNISHEIQSQVYTCWRHIFWHRLLRTVLFIFWALVAVSIYWLVVISYRTFVLHVAFERELNTLIDKADPIELDDLMTALKIAANKRCNRTDAQAAVEDLANTGRRGLALHVAGSGGKRGWM